MTFEGFDTRQGHTKTLKMEVMAAHLGAQGCGVCIMTDWLINGPVVLVTYPGNAVI